MATALTDSMCQANASTSDDPVSPSALQSGVGAEADYAELIEWHLKRSAHFSQSGFEDHQEIGRKHLRFAGAIHTLLAENTRLREALQNMNGAFNTPIMRRRLAGDDFALECIKSCADALASAPTSSEEARSADTGSPVAEHSPDTNVIRDQVRRETIEECAKVVRDRIGRGSTHKAILDLLASAPRPDEERSDTTDHLV